MLSSLTPFPRILFFILLMISSFGLFFLAGLALAVPVFGIGLSDLIKAAEFSDDPSNLSLLRYFQVLQSMGLFVVPPILAALFFSTTPVRYLSMDRTPGFWVFCFAALAVLSSMPFINWLITINESMSLPVWLGEVEQWMRDTEDQAAALTEAFLKMPDTGTFFFNLFMIAVIPAIGEEMVFRGVLQRLFTEWLGNIHFAVILSALCFSAMHMQFYGFIPRLTLGLILGYMMVFSGSLWVPILAHFVQNGTVVVVTWLEIAGLWKIDSGSFGQSDNAWLILLSGILMTGWLVMIRMWGRPRKVINS